MLDGNRPFLEILLSLIAVKISFTGGAQLLLCPDCRGTAQPVPSGGPIIQHMVPRMSLVP